jgi:FKBP-type peptidyl-prolyl cis-trans isomerase FklB
MNNSFLHCAYLFPLLLSCAYAEQSLDSDPQKASYALGVELMKNLARDGLSLDQPAFLQGVNDVLGNQSLRLNSSELLAAKDWWMVQRVKYRNAKGEENLTIGKAFLEKNARLEGVHALDSGLQYRVIQEGEGDLHPQNTDGVRLRFRLSNLAGQTLLSSEPETEARVVLLKSLIDGWQEALALMTVGAKWTLYLPANLAYGDAGTPDGKIGPNETLIYDLELLAVIADAVNKPELINNTRKISKPLSQ